VSDDRAIRQARHNEITDLRKLTAAANRLLWAQDQMIGDSPSPAVKRARDLYNVQVERYKRIYSPRPGNKNTPMSAH